LKKEGAIFAKKIRREEAIEAGKRLV